MVLFEMVCMQISVIGTVKICSFIELGFRYAETLGKKICERKQMRYCYPSTCISPQIHCGMKGALEDL